MEPEGWTGERLAGHLRALGLEPATDVLVHASMRAVGRVHGGPATVLAALRDVLGPEATIVVPTQTPSNSLTSAAYLQRFADAPEALIKEHRERAPAFDPASSPSEGMGILAEHLRCEKGARRSDHPTSSFAALGPAAREITRRHPRESHLGPDSPLGALAARGAQVLLLGVGYDKTTAFHLAEYRVDPVPRTYCSKILTACSEDGPKPRWEEYQGIRLDDSDFDLIGKNMESRTSFVRRGMIGGALSLCFPMIGAVEFAEKWMRESSAE